MATKIHEVIVNTDFLKPQKLAPDIGQLPFEGASRCPENLAKFGSFVLGSGLIALLRVLVVDPALEAP